MKKLKFKGLKFLAFVIFLYMVLLLINTEPTLEALRVSAITLYKLSPIFILIILISSLINYYLKPQHIIKHLGEDSGLKGVFYALISGVLSHGPIYMWYGIIDDLKKSGAKEKLIIIFLYARAVKIPLLVFMIGLFGVTFTIIMTLYTLLASIAQGYIFESLYKGETIDVK